MSPSARPTALLWDPWLKAFGGGERYLAALGRAAAETHEVIVASPGPPPATDRLEAFGFPTRWEQVREAQLPARSAAVDVLVNLTLEPPPPSRARRSILIVQFPTRPLSRIRQVKAAQERALDAYDLVSYSAFADGWLRRRWGRGSEVLAPPVITGSYEPSGKEPLILSVGRFFTQGHSKRQDVLIEAFRQLAPALPGWRLVLAGGVDGADRTALAFVERLRRASEDLPVTIEVDATAERLSELYGEAALYWHAAGFGRPAAAPERAEHFGISTVEAMSHGAVPVVYDDGGQREVVTSSVGARWRSVGELVDQTAALARDEGRRRQLASCAAREAAAFAETTFLQRAAELLARPAPPRPSAGDPPLVVTVLRRAQRVERAARYASRVVADRSKTLR